MEENQFQRGAETNQTLADYLDEVAQSVSSDQTDRSVGLDIAFAMASYALYLWTRNYLDHQRGLKEANLRELMEKEIDKFVEKGYSRAEALSNVRAISKQVALRPPDDSVLKAALSLIKKVG